MRFFVDISGFIEGGGYLVLPPGVPSFAPRGT